MLDDLRLVLVHGGWGHPDMWRYVVEELGELGDRVAIADLPTTNRADAVLADDVAHVRSLADAPRVVLCGHSYGGAVISEAAHSLSGVASLVYVAGFVPDVGESVFDWLTKRPIEGPPLQFFDDGTSLPAGWAQDDGRYDAATLARMRTVSLRPHTVAAAVTPLQAAAWHSRPSVYLLATDDDVIDPETQREMASRALMPIVEVECGHMVTFARPDVVAATLTAAIDRLAGPTAD